MDRLISVYNFHYLFKGYNYLSELQNTLKLTRPHEGKLLRKRKFCKFNHFQVS